MKRRSFLATGTVAAATALTRPAFAADSPAPLEHAPSVMRYLDRIYAESRREHACTATDAAAHMAWRDRARPALHALLGLDRMAEELTGWEPKITLGETETLDGYTRTKGVMSPEPDVSVPFYLLRPPGAGPFPLAVMPHGHGPHGRYANIYRTQKEKEHIAHEDRDVAVQAVRRGYIAIAPATRGLGCPGVPDIDKRHSDRDCRSQMVHCLLAGRTPMGERVWDMSRLLDWGLALPGIDARRTLIMGNSGGGVVSLFAAACDPRFAVSVSSCAYSSFIKKDGTVQLCDCNLVPGILRFGDAHDIAGLIAPRYFQAVHGEKDKLFNQDDVQRSAARTRSVFESADVPGHFDLQVGPEGHRFYKDLMWPFIDKAMG
jgi:dienelactone hydrolase